MNRSAPYVLVLPNILVVLVFAIYPLIANFIMSVTGEAADGSTIFVGLGQYAEIADDPTFWIAFKNTAYYSAVLVVPTLVLSLAFAIAMNQKIPFKGALRAMYLLPYLLSWAVIGLVWRWLYSSNYGILNAILSALGLPESRWILDPELTIPLLALTGIWQGVGYYMVIYLAGLQGIAQEMYEAARLDGANAWDQFRYLTVPALRPITLLVTCLAVIGSFRVFEQVYVMTGGGPGTASFTLVFYIFIKGLQESDVGFAAGLSVILFVILLCATFIMTRLVRDDD